MGFFRGGTLGSLFPSKNCYNLCDNLEVTRHIHNCIQAALSFTVTFDTQTHELIIWGCLAYICPISKLNQETDPLCPSAISDPRLYGAIVGSNLRSPASLSMMQYRLGGRDGKAAITPLVTITQTSTLITPKGHFKIQVLQCKFNF